MDFSFPSLYEQSSQSPFKGLTEELLQNRTLWSKCHLKAVQSNSTTDTYHSSEGRRDQSAVDGYKTAADQRLWTGHIVKLQEMLSQ